MGWRGILGFEYGVIQAPLGPDISGPELVAAVANAGALGFLRAPDSDSPDFVREQIRKTRALTDKPFGVAIVLKFPYTENLKVILEEKVAVLETYWGQLPQEVVQQAHAAGVKIVPQIGDPEEARKVIALGVDAIMVQGHQAGGHVVAQECLMTLLPLVVTIVGNKDIPIIAAGGIVDSEGYVKALSLGANAVALGTRFVATDESYAHPIYKEKLIEYGWTALTNIFGRARWPNAPQRVLATPVYKQHRLIANDVTENDQPAIGHAVINGQKTQIRLLAGTVPNRTAEGDIEHMVMYGGEGVGLIKEILPAAEVVKRVVDGAKCILQEA